MPPLMAELRSRKDICARALEITVLTNLRTGAVIKAEWDEIDLEKRIWTVPGKRMKPRRGEVPKDHIVPLSTRVVKILEQLPRVDGSKWVFQGTKRKHLGEREMLRLLQSMRRVTIHGFRSSFRDWAGERTNYQDEVIEFAMAHGIPDKAKAAYRRYRSLDKRGRLMEDWARYCEAPAAKGDNVHSLRSA
jgi:integrase